MNVLTIYRCLKVSVTDSLIKRRSFSYCNKWRVTARTFSASSFVLLSFLTVVLLLPACIPFCVYLYAFESFNESSVPVIGRVLSPTFFSRLPHSVPRYKLSPTVIVSKLYRKAGRWNTAIRQVESYWHPIPQTSNFLHPVCMADTLRRSSVGGSRKARFRSLFFLHVSYTGSLGLRRAPFDKQESKTSQVRRTKAMTTELVVRGATPNDAHQGEFLRRPRHDCSVSLEVMSCKKRGEGGRSPGAVPSPTSSRCTIAKGLVTHEPSGRPAARGDTIWNAPSWGPYDQRQEIR